jgi:hypothetical protein
MSQGHVKKHLIRELIQPPVAHFKQLFEELKTLISTYTKFGLFITGIPLFTTYIKRDLFSERKSAQRLSKRSGQQNSV